MADPLKLQSHIEPLTDEHNDCEPEKMIMQKEIIVMLGNALCAASAGFEQTDSNCPRCVILL